jgi:tetratricopeptide (TPR) repeat protein
VHRDIKPPNLMVDRRDVIRIVDFGIARTEGSGMTMDGAMIGTLSYMSPEQMLGRQVDFRSDIFAVGAVAYELLSYQQAFRGTLDDGLLQRLHEEPPSLSAVCPGLPAAVEKLVMQALARRPEDRFADLEELRVSLREIRRNINPDLQLESLAEPTLPRRPGSKPTPTPASSSERRDILERRARQIAVHRDAARAALAAHDLDAALAACEDALTLDPDDAEALQLRAEIQQAQSSNERTARERRDRERTVRQRIADADLKLEKGDTAGAIAALHQALAVDSTNAAAFAMLSRIQPKPRAVSRSRMVAAMCALAGAALGGGLWIASSGSGERPAAPEPSPAAPVAIASPDPAPVAVVPAAPLPSAPKPEKVVPVAPPAVAPKPLPDRTVERIERAHPTPPVVSPSSTERALGDTPVASPPVSIEQPPPSVPVVATPPPAPVAEAPAPAPPPASTTTNVAVATPVVPPSPLERERAGILRALNRYQYAYRERNVKLLLDVFPGLPREDQQKLERAFRDCRDFDVTFGAMQTALDAENPTLATVTVRTIYTCQPKTAQAAQPQAVLDVFAMRKIDDGWLIDSTGMMNAGRR